MYGYSLFSVNFNGTNGFLSGTCGCRLIARQQGMILL